ncbi:hypothetical protein ABIF96_005761 [Bradyrhizobium ottawaense]|uniref:hypothetical protein n=1 Tax=Bradyrhizobium ottawaense TaxID=931866 RepID=UPI003832B101
MTQNLELSSRPALGDGGNLDTQAGSRGVVTQHNSDAKNVIRFPTRSSLASANSELPSGAPLFIQDDLDFAVLCALAIILTSGLISIGCLLYAGKLIFGLFDFG